MCTDNEHSTRGNDQRARTLTPDDLHPHAGVLVPMDRVELDEARDDRLVEVGVLHGVRVRVTFKHLVHTDCSSVMSYPSDTPLSCILSVLYNLQIGCYESYSSLVSIRICLKWLSLILTVSYQTFSPLMWGKLFAVM